MRLLILFIFASFMVTNTFGQLHHPQNKEEIIGVCDKFMQAFIAGNYEEGFDKLKSYSAIDDGKIDTLAATTKSQMTEIVAVYGKILSYEELSEKDVKNTFIRLIYIAKLDKFFLKFSFTLYNNGAGWTISNFNYNDKPDDLF